VRKILLIIISLMLSNYLSITIADVEYGRGLGELINSIPTIKEDKLFIKEYIYDASEDDSKNSSRKKAIRQIKFLLTEEIGTHIENYLEIKKTNINGTSYKSIQQEIKSLSVGITKIQILSERWNGRSYFVRASVKINEEQVMELLLQSIKAKSSKKDVKRLNKILKEQKQLLTQQNSKVRNINKQLIKQEIVNEARKNEILKMKKQLIEYNAREIKQKKEEKKYKTELERKKYLINKLNRKTGSKVDKIKKNWIDKKELLCSFNVGTSKKNIENITDTVMGKSNHQYLNVYGEKRNSKRFNITLLRYYKYRICPDKFLNNLGYNCIYFNLENELMSERGGCKKIIN
jgi:hypothetical protein